MARRFLNDVRADIDTDIATNGVGNISALILNPILNDMVDSTVQKSSAIFGFTPVALIATAITFQSLTTVYEGETGDDGDFLNTDFLNGTITNSATAGFTYDLFGNVSYTDVGNGIPVEFAILLNGVEQGFVASTTGGGTGDPVSAAFIHTDLSAPSSGVWSIGVRTPNGVDTIDIISIAMGCVVQPTDGP